MEDGSAFRDIPYPVIRAAGRKLAVFIFLPFPQEATSATTITEPPEMNFFKTLLHPDQEELEHADRMVVVTAANLLQVGEFQFLQLAYREWFGHDLPETLIAKLFSDYMLQDDVPHWARHYARLILTREERGTLDADDPAYHRYDRDYHTSVPQGVRRFCTAAGVLMFALVSGILVASMAVDQPTSLLPPYFERSHLDGNREDLTTGNSDVLQEAPERSAGAGR